MIDEKKLIEDILQHENVLASANHINRQPKVGEWIPVGDELPEDDRLVLVTVNDKHNNLTFENALMTGCYCCAEGWILEGYLWLPYYCEFAETKCPDAGVACWEQYLTHKDKREDRDDQ